MIDKMYHSVANVIAFTLIKIGEGAVSVCLRVEAMLLNTKEGKG